MAENERYVPPGPWDDESKGPVFFEAHGLPCALVRSPFYNWNGYVGVPHGHPFFGKSYSDHITPPEKFWEQPVDVNEVGVITMFCAPILVTKEDGKLKTVAIELFLRAHGGITFADNHPAGREDPTNGSHWWFGFDCGHSGDISPCMLQYDLARRMGVPISGADEIRPDRQDVEALLNERAYSGRSGSWPDIYRVESYARDQTIYLAEQLAGLTEIPPEDRKDG